MGTISSTPLPGGVSAYKAPALPPAGDRLVIPDLLGSLIAWAAQLQARRRQRAALRKLDERMLRDIGVSVADAEMEADKWPWQP